MRTKLTFMLMAIFQVTLAQQNISDFIEETGFSGERNLADLLEEYNYYQKNPIQLNQIELEQLKEISFFSDDQAEEIINYRSRNNGFVAKEELQLLNSISNEQYKILSKIVTVSIDKKYYRKNHITLPNVNKST